MFKIKNLWLVMFALIALVMVNATMADVPNKINYQGYLTDDAGTPVADDDYSIFFLIYDSAIDGTRLWSSDRMTIPVENGLFSVELGPLDPEIFASAGDRYLAIRVGADPEIDPRTRLISAPYALVSQYGGGWVDDGTDVRLITSSDNVGIGISSPSHKLEVMASSGDDVAYFQGSGQNGVQSYISLANGTPNAYAFNGRTSGGDGHNRGVYGLATDAKTGTGVLGVSYGNTHNSYGVIGEAGVSGDSAPIQYGVYGRAENGGTTNYGVYGDAQGGATATNYGVYGHASGASTNYAGYFAGDVHITGTLTGGGVSDGIPSGAIIMWSGPLSSIPSGWGLCDGNFGRPDLTDRFVVGVGTGQDPGLTGGSPNHTHIVDPPATQTVSSGATKNVGSGVGETVSQPTHAHNIDMAGFSSQSANNSPPYYTIAFIMKL